MLSLTRLSPDLKKTELVPAPGPAVEPRARGISEGSTETEPMEIRKAFISGVIDLLCMQMLLIAITKGLQGNYKVITNKYSSETPFVSLIITKRYINYSVYII